MHCVLHTIACRVTASVGVLHRVRMVVMVAMHDIDWQEWGWYDQATTIIIIAVTGDEGAGIAPVMSVMVGKHVWWCYCCHSGRREAVFDDHLSSLGARLIRENLLQWSSTSSRAIRRRLDHGARSWLAGQHHSSLLKHL